jgi:hypothetical protein
MCQDCGELRIAGGGSQPHQRITPQGLHDAVLRGTFGDQTTAAQDKPSPQTEPKTGAEKPTDANTSAPVDCSEIDSTTKPCTISHTFQSNDREWWDVSLGLALPGVKQTTFSAPSGKVVASTTTHADVYAFFDLGYDLQNKGLRFPHLDVGIPVASQSLYRPFVGVGQWLTPLLGLEKKKFPLRMGA